jgi:hypothetical protein
VRAALDGGYLLIRQDSLIVGKHTGSNAEFDLNSGILESVMDIFVGGASVSARRMNHSLLRIRGGSLTGLSLTIGEGLGSNSTVDIVGSAPQSISALEFVEMHAQSDPGGTPEVSTLSFTLDAHGVTPIMISSRFGGLHIDHDSSSTCRLQVNLSAVPPRDDITLIKSRASNDGEFSGLPEGAQITASFNGHTYMWTLTYRGGTSGHDVVLHNQSTRRMSLSPTHAPLQIRFLLHGTATQFSLWRSSRAYRHSPEQKVTEVTRKADEVAG